MASAISASTLHRVGADARVAGFADRGQGFVDLLHHRSDEAGELRNPAREDRPAEIDVAKNPIERISMLMIGCSLEKRARHF